ncbi:MAG: hypothetical protein JNM22_23105 [Saprospiraceae bacterium]|nr:hypothetical protein [Saprospiraceae bacterium]
MLVVSYWLSVIGYQGGKGAFHGRYQLSVIGYQGGKGAFEQILGQSGCGLTKWFNHLVNIGTNVGMLWEIAAEWEGIFFKRQGVLILDLRLHDLRFKIT